MLCKQLKHYPVKSAQHINKKKKDSAVSPQPAESCSVQSESPTHPDAEGLMGTLFSHVPPTLAELPPDDGEDDGYQEDEAAGH